ncbi:hypothetical protein [Thermostichus vulcanus]|uniref:Uncharacterized protein n=1 Tax=Thermostichus vulcanus str. 'Rupite' TaxID=2813851 RepID=A0ABT0CCH1_THEVL|nr:hypothetical protein [Thermostichus vulcanus]MCJ2543419.1 hypothetical protein [Thermostichus vulcanus str. 'Rupite']
MAGIHPLRWYMCWASGAAPALLALLLLSNQAAQASQASALEPQPQFDLNVIRSRTLPWQRPPMVFEPADPSDADEWGADDAEHPFLEFTLEESNTAIALFGCDCPAHLNQLRQMRGLPLL